MTPAPTFRLRDALRDLVRAPRAASLVIAIAVALCLAPLVLYTMSASHRIASAADGRAAFTAYLTWAAVAIVMGAILARAAAALVASAMVASRERDDLPFAVALARVLAHGVPALFAAMTSIALAGLGLVVAAGGIAPVAAAEELIRNHAHGVPALLASILACAIAIVVAVAALAAAGALAALTFVAGPAAAVEQLPPSAAIRRGAILARAARWRIGAWIGGALVVELVPVAIARLAIYDGTGKKPPVEPILHLQAIHGAIVIAVAVIAALVPVATYRRLRG